MILGSGRHRYAAQLAPSLARTINAFFDDATVTTYFLTLLLLCVLDGGFAPISLSSRRCRTAGLQRFRRAADASHRRAQISRQFLSSCLSLRAQRRRRFPLFPSFIQTNTPSPRFSTTSTCRCSPCRTRHRLTPRRSPTRRLPRFYPSSSDSILPRGYRDSSFCNFAPIAPGRVGAKVLSPAAIAPMLRSGAVVAIDGALQPLIQLVMSHQLDGNWEDFCTGVVAYYSALMDSVRGNAQLIDCEELQPASLRFLTFFARHWAFPPFQDKYPFDFWLPFLLRVVERLAGDEEPAVDRFILFSRSSRDSSRALPLRQWNRGNSPAVYRHRAAAASRPTCSRHRRRHRPSL